MHKVKFFGGRTRIHVPLFFIQSFSQKTFLSLRLIGWVWLSIDTLLVTLDIEHIIFLAVNYSN